ncbi:MAG: hypothetical protein IJA61_01745 [Clostridia bacterium]|nr:hypothetical protein [Clostridia bacterium]
MRKSMCLVLLLCICFPCMFFVGCGGDSGTPIGIYYVSKVVDTKNETIINREDFELIGEEYVTLIDAIIYINEDGTYKKALVNENSVSYLIDGTWTQSGKTLTLIKPTITEEEDAEKETATFQNNSLIFTEENIQIVFAKL